MKYENFIATLREYQATSAREDTQYFTTLDRLKGVQEDVAQLDTQQHVLETIKPFLIKWGKMGRVIGGNFAWEKLGEVLRGLKPQFDWFRGQMFLTADFTDPVTRNAIMKICTELRQVKKLGPTGIIKIVHLLNPEIFVLWDAGIRHYFHVRNKQINETPEGYIDFLREMQGRLRVSLRGYQNRTEEEVKNLVNAVRQEFHGKTLAKLCDEYNWAISRFDIA